MSLWPVEHFLPHFGVSVVYGSEEKSVQLVKGSSFRNDLLQNPYFSAQA